MFPNTMSVYHTLVTPQIISMSPRTAITRHNNKNHIIKHLSVHNTQLCS